jgi:undecaprenyl-diphosphatase
MHFFHCLDAPIMAAIDHSPHSYAANHLMLLVAESDLLKGGLFMACLWLLWFRSDGDPAVQRRSLLISLVGALVAVVVAHALQRVLTPEQPVYGVRFVHTYKIFAHYAGFPSDHAAFFAALAAAIWLESRRLGAFAIAWAAIVVCGARVYVGYHYPSDVLGGAIIGVALMLATRRTLRDAAWPARVIGWETTHRTAFYATAFLLTFETSLLFQDVRTLGHGGLQVLRTTLSLASDQSGPAWTGF